MISATTVFDQTKLRELTNKSFVVIVKVPIVYETIDHDLDKYHDNENNVIFDAPNGYKYFAIDGLTISFFRPIENDVNYHVVICELSQQQLNYMNVLYEDLLKLNPIFTFDFK